MSCWLYILRCADGHYYIDCTDDLERDLAKHHAGKFIDYTRRRRPLKFMLSQEFPTRAEALKVARRLKLGNREGKNEYLRQHGVNVSKWGLSEISSPADLTKSRSNEDSGAEKNKL